MIAIVKNGVPHFDTPLPWPDGTVLEVVAKPQATPPAESGRNSDPQPGSLAELLAEYKGVVDDLPSDYALNHEHYRYGTPKR